MSSYLDALAQVVAPAAVQVDQQGSFPRAAVDAGRHLSTLAFSEAGSRSHFDRLALAI